ncbi:MAG: Agmatinase [Thermodesulfobacteriota bacterium]|nr:Agmatinase [Thermodesulfobacteriota bacterium]
MGVFGTMNDHFIGSKFRRIIPGSPVLIGCPLDLTTTYRHGCDDAPSAIRASSYSLETFSPFFWRDLEDLSFGDVGDLSFVGLRMEDGLALIEEAVCDGLAKGGLPLCMGGEHTITLPIVRALESQKPGFVVLHLDAHTDLRQHYDGTGVNHATVIRRIAEVVGSDRLIQMGIRSGTREEWLWMRDHGTLLQWEALSDAVLDRRIGGRPVYLTLDLDVFDPACMPATGNPESGGWFYADFERLLRKLQRHDVLGADVVELNPRLDPSEASSIMAAKILREILILLARSRQ